MVTTEHRPLQSGDRPLEVVMRLVLRDGRRCFTLFLAAGYLLGLAENAAAK
jgi:hypothetical protein